MRRRCLGQTRNSRTFDDFGDVDERAKATRWHLDFSRASAPCAAVRAGALARGPRLLRALFFQHFLGLPPDDLSGLDVLQN